MNDLTKVLRFKIAATLLFWAAPLILFPASWIEAAGFPRQDTYMFIRMLGWAYLALCVGYWFGLKASRRGEKASGPVWMGIVSNGGACLYLLYYGAVGTWHSWGGFARFALWASAAATLCITLALFWFGVRGDGSPTEEQR